MVTGGQSTWSLQSESGITSYCSSPSLSPKNDNAMLYFCGHLAPTLTHKYIYSSRSQCRSISRKNSDNCSLINNETELVVTENGGDCFSMSSLSD